MDNEPKTIWGKRLVNGVANAVCQLEETEKQAKADAERYKNLYIKRVDDTVALKQRVEELENLVSDLFKTKCTMSCGDCENDADDGCALMDRARELGIEVR